MTVPLMGRAPNKGASTEMNVPLAVPVANPLGSALTPSIKVKYSSLEAKSGSNVGVSVADVLVLMYSLEEVLLLAEVPPLGTRTEKARACEGALRAKAAADVAVNVTNKAFE
jgi:hypothetical protein